MHPQFRTMTPIYHQVANQVLISFLITPPNDFPDVEIVSSQTAPPQASTTLTQEMDDIEVRPKKRQKQTLISDIFTKKSKK